MKIESEVDDIIKRTVKKGATSGLVHLPKAWVGKYVIVCLLTEEQQEAARKIDAPTETQSAEESEPTNENSM